ncbi:SatD family protein [Aeromicrobium sp.]|uniref:SatD family protein n=1 Tax=Aeromicrobium sp. TaxID=1871063 RepID=UPI003D6B14BD
MKSDASVEITLIGDLVGSRRAPSRISIQQQLVAALAITNETTSSVQPLAPTIGDEFQGVYADVGSALRASLVVRLALPVDVDCRFGIGAGGREIVGTSEYGLTQDGPAWWAARDAIVEAKRRESGQNKRLRSWFAVPEGEGDSVDAGLVNAFLLCRDELVSRLDARQRRLVLGALRGTSQKELAASEGISPSAVSQSLQRAGAFALLDATELVTQ